MILLHRLTAHNFKQLTDVSLAFPERGTILIEGANEAGKSSLFEAIYFALYGRALITDRDFGQAALRKYGEDELRVELEFSIEGRRFHIARRVGNNQTATLTCPGADGATEVLRKNTPIQERLRDELRLSAEALLNTCFVGQKDLGRLEEMDAAKRKEAINELLNLRILTGLETHFKITTEDQNGLRLRRERLEIARLDTALPALERDARFALDCLHYTRLREEEARGRRIQQDIEAAQTERAEIARRRRALAARLEEAARLSQRLDAIDGALTLGARAWGEAAGHAESARQEWAALAALEAALPARGEQQAAWEQMAQGLALLETLETEAQDRERELAEQQQRIADCNQLRAEWEAERARQQTLQAERERRRQALAAADQRLEARSGMNRRDAQMAHLQQQIAAWESAAREAEALREGLEQTRACAERLPERAARHAELENLEARENQAATDRQELARVEREAGAARQKRQEAETRRERIARLEADHARQRGEAGTAREAEQRAALALQDAQARLELLDWAEAMERAEQAGASLPRFEEIETRQEQARQRLEARGAEGRQSARRVLISAGVLGAGVLLGIVGALANVALAGAGIALALVGAALCLGAQKRRRAAQGAEAEARRQGDQLAGERQAAQMVREAQAQQAEDWARRAAQSRERLQQRRQEVPATARAAREQAASLPERSVSEAQAAHRAAEDGAREADNDCGLTLQTLRHERELARQEDQAAMETQERALQTEIDALALRLESAEALPGLRAALGVGADPDALRAAIQAAAQEAADSRSAQTRLPEMQAQTDAKADQALRGESDIAEFAGGLLLPGQDIAAWKAGAQAERETLLEAVRQNSDAALQAAGEQARQALSNVEREAAALDTRQADRAAALEAATLPLWEQQAEATQERIAANAQEQADYGHIRPALQEVALPLASAELKIHLARTAETLRLDQIRAARRAEAEQKREQAARVARQHQDITQTAWRAQFASLPLPETPEEAARQLTGLRAMTEQELAELDEPGLRDTDARWLARDGQLAGEMLSGQQAQQEGNAGQRQLREALDAGDAELPEDMPARLPHLARAGEKDAAGWETEAQKRREAARDNRSRRHMRAEALGLAETPLEEDAEHHALDAATRALEVKQRAGEAVARTRQSIVNRVMPLTEMNMRLLLPLLTEGRYQDLKWEEALNAVVVYDQRAREFQRKRVFSGGAKDQISLALRLAFALATLPGEHNARPGFLFLDEPLSSFDRTRARALVDLLTRGLIREKFQQVFLVSHSEAFDPACFEHRLRMEGGRIAECTLAG